LTSVSSHAPVAELALRLRQQELAASFGRFALQQDELQPVLDEACRTAALGLETPFAKVLEHLPAEGALLIRAGVGWRPGVVGHVRIDSDSGTAPGYAFQTGQPVIADHQSERVRFRTPSVLVEHGVRRSINVVIGDRDNQPFGVLEADSSDRARFVMPDIAFLEALATTLAVVADRQAREAALRASETRLRRVLDLVPAGIIEADADGVFRYVNPAAQAILRMAPEMAVGRSYAAAEWAVTTPDGRPVPSEQLPVARALRGEMVHGYEHLFSNRAGERIRLQVDAAPVRGADGTITGMVAAFSDVSEQRAAETALRRSEEEFRALAENLPNLCWMANADGWIYWYNKRWYDYTGTTPAEMEGWGWQSVHDPLVLPAVMERWTGAIVGGVPFEMIFPLRGADGVFRPFLTRIMPVQDEQGAITRWFGSNVDVSEQQRTEAAIRESEARFREMADCMPMIVWTARPDGFVDYYNERWYALTGQPRGEGGDPSWEPVLHPDDVQRCKDVWYASVRFGEAYELEYRFLDRVSGEYRWHLGRALPGREASGAVAKWFGTCIDIDDRKRLEDELRRLNEGLEARIREEVAAREEAQSRLAQAQRMEALGQLAGGIAHDFNNVLQAVVGGLSLIQRRAGDAETVQQLARMAGDAAVRGSAITARLLTFARKGELQTVPVPLVPLLENLREMLAPTLGANVAVAVEVEPGAPPLLADKAQLETVLVNLAVNARDAMPDGGSLTVSASVEAVGDSVGHPAGLAPGAYLRLDLADTGIGMDAAVLARASEPFFTTKPMGQGTGLGLAMARGFAQQSGGGFALQSAPGQGTVASLWFPQAWDAAASRAERIALAPPSRAVTGACVMVVDDNAMVREVLAGQMEGLGHRVIQASDGLDALARLDEGAEVDLLVTDLSMPGMSGRVLIGEARRRRPGLPALLLTGYADTDGRLGSEIEQDNTTLLLRKPVSGDELARHAATLLAAKAMAAG